MVDVLPEWTLRGVKSSECVERKDGSESQKKRKQMSFERHSNSKPKHDMQTLQLSLFEVGDFKQGGQPSNGRKRYLI